MAKKHTRLCGTCRKATADMTEEQAKDFDFYGECEYCRASPLSGDTRGESPANAHDREYHGGQFNSGEW